MSYYKYTQTHTVTIYHKLDIIYYKFPCHYIYDKLFLSTTTHTHTTLDHTGYYYNHTNTDTHYDQTYSISTDCA